MIDVINFEIDLSVGLASDCPRNHVPVFEHKDFDARENLAKDRDSNCTALIEFCVPATRDEKCIRMASSKDGIERLRIHSPFSSTRSRLIPPLAVYDSFRANERRKIIERYDK